MKYLGIIIIALYSLTLFASINYEGDWEIKTLGASNKAKITQEGNVISVFRVIKQNFQGEEYVLFHLMKGNISDNKLKLYVKEDGLKKFEYLRDVSFRVKDNNTFKIDGKTYIRKNKKNKDNGNEIKIIYLKDKKNKKEENSYAKQKEPVFILPAGLGDKQNKDLRQIKISAGFTTEENALNMKGIRLMKRKHYNEALKIFLNLYKKNPNNISLLIKLQNTYSLIGNKKQSEYYCKKIKKYDPYYLCGE